MRVELRSKKTESVFLDVSSLCAGGVNLLHVLCGRSAEAASFLAHGFFFGGNVGGFGGEISEVNICSHCRRVLNIKTSSSLSRIRTNGLEKF